MANYVLVHGSAHGSWCWQRVIPLLRQWGHTVTAVDLPGNGHDNTPLAEVTLDSYAQYVGGVLDVQDAPAVLVGHSLGRANHQPRRRTAPAQCRRIGLSYRVVAGGWRRLYARPILGAGRCAPRPVRPR